MSEVKFNATIEEMGIINKIAERAMKFYPEADELTFFMDIEACHSNGCPLKLQELLEADDFNFQHDIAGIDRHIDHETGKLQNFFLPRYADLGEKYALTISVYKLKGEEFRPFYVKFTNSIADAKSILKSLNLNYEEIEPREIERGTVMSATIAIRTDKKTKDGNVYKTIEKTNYKDNWFPYSVTLLPESDTPLSEWDDIDKYREF